LTAAHVSSRRDITCSTAAAKQVGILLFHGLTGMPSELRFIKRYLERQGYRVETPLLLGHGDGHGELLATTWQDWVKGAQRDLERMKSNCRHIFVGGLSMGASMAAMLAAEDKSINGIIMLSTTLRYDGASIPALEVLLPLVDLLPFLGRWCYWTEDPPYGLKDRRLQKIITRSVQAAAKGETTDFGLFRTYAGSLRQMSFLVDAVRLKTHLVTCPTLIVHSLEDTMTSIHNATEIYSRISSQDKTIAFLNACDHVLTLDLRKRDVAHIIADFVGRIVSRAKENLACHHA